MNSKREVLIIGAGILGASHARELSKFGDLNVTVIDQVAAPAMNHGTGASSACIRRCYSSEALTLMADYGVRALLDLQRAHADTPLFSQVGCLTVGAPDAEFMRVQKSIFDQVTFELHSMNLSQLKENYPACEFTEGEAGLLDAESGYASPHLVTEILAQEAKANGAKFIFNSKVAAVIEEKSRVTGVRLQNGETLKADLIICASAYGTKDLLKSVGVKLPMSTSIRPIFTAFFESRQSKGIPVVADLTNEIYFRPESGGVLIGSLAEEDETETIDHPVETFDVKKERLESLAERAATRLPFINLNPSSIRIVRGLYDVNDLDWMPIQGASGIENLHLSFATSGHGFKLAFALSKILATQLGIAELPPELMKVGSTLFENNENRVKSGGVLS